MRYTHENYGSIKEMLMEQSFTLENDMAMIISLLTEMVENKNLTDKQMETVMETIFFKMDKEITHNQPSESVVNTIMSYSKALRVLKPKKNQTFTMIIN
jgi:antitoxin component HigA of HigAB toxin-antitoxin module